MLATLKEVLGIINKFSRPGNDTDRAYNADALVKYMFKKENGNMYKYYIQKLSKCYGDAKMMGRVDNDGQNIDKLISDLKDTDFCIFPIDDMFETEHSYASKQNIIKKTIKHMKPGVVLIKYSGLSENNMLILFFDGVPCYNMSFVAAKLPYIQTQELYDEYGQNKDMFMRTLDMKISNNNLISETYAHIFYSLYGDKEMAYQKLMEFISL